MWKTKGKLIINILAGLVVIVAILTFYSTFSLNTEYVFKSDVYSINDGYIEGISINTSIELFNKYFDIDNCSIKVVDRDNNEINSGYVVNGSTTVLYGANDKVIDSYVNVIKGDYNADGILDSNDFYDMGKCLVDMCSIDNFLLKSIDIDGDGEFHINDLVLLDKAMTLGYTGISIEENNLILQTNEVGRLVSRVEPLYGVNSNVKWESSNKEIAIVDDSGRVTGVNEGEVIIKAMTLDERFEDKIKVVVDNTIQLESYEGLSYVGGNDKKIWIKSVDYDNLSCSVSNEDVASCLIEDKTLILSGKSVGNVIVTVSSPTYGDVTYSLSVKSVYLNIMPEYLCMTSSNSAFITVSGFNTGNLSFEFSDRDIIKDAYMSMYDTRRMLRIDSGSKQGRAILKVTEDNGNTSGEVVIDVTGLSLSDAGVFAKVGEEVSVTAVNENVGTLSCKSLDESMGTCRIENNKIIVTPLKLGIFNVDVYSNFSYGTYHQRCDQSQFVVVVREE